MKAPFFPVAALSFGFLFSCSSSYQTIHQKAVLVDTHNDVLSQVIFEGLSVEQDLTGKAHTDLQRMKEGGLDVQVFAVFSDETYGPGRAFKFANQQIDSLEALARRNPDKLQMVYSPAQMREAVKAKKIASLTGVEGGHMIEDNLDNLNHLYGRGVRYLTLTWNNSTSWASSAADETKTSGFTQKKGLNDFGKQVVRRMNDIGMLVDLSHVGEQTFWDVLATTTKPVLVSHSCAAALCPHPRNLKDDQIKALGKNGGVLHLNFFSEFLDPGYSQRIKGFISKHEAEISELQKKGMGGMAIREALFKKYPEESKNVNPPISLLIDHIDHVVKLAGVDHVGLGSDYDGISSAPAGLEDVSTYPLITKALLERGYKKKDIEKILGGNFIRVWEANEPKPVAKK
ncbi:dipeptidase [Rufibacter glacialis]|uniref:Dipeptidase n=1 Tax=Rufibacter glacialis TaxID=1259555 RepID=A0A5M8QIU9_9BACT|nr:dipeptidase [Rufibacter glacialis]KAA6434292.1 membrane dipeptidase [Rufibacter glacialis]GGK68346.1 dipeptidase [Rufibacter glacialis]